MRKGGRICRRPGCPRQGKKAQRAVTIRENNMKKIILSYLTPQALWRIFCTVAAVIVMGFSLSLLILTDMGTDPYSCMNLGISETLHMSFGTWQVLINGVLLIAVFFLKRSLIGIGTVANMVLVGYSSDFFGSIWRRVPVLSGELEGAVRIAVLLGALALFVCAAAVYMTSNLGTAPYDAIAFILAQRVRRLSFRTLRMLCDLTAVAIGFLFGSTVGIISILMILTLGPVVAWFGEHVAWRLFGRAKRPEDGSEGQTDMKEKT